MIQNGEFYEEDKEMMDLMEKLKILKEKTRNQKK